MRAYIQRVRNSRRYVGGKVEWDQPVEKLRALRGAFGVGRGVGPSSIFRPRLFAEFYNSLGNMGGMDWWTSDG